MTVSSGSGRASRLSTAPSSAARPAAPRPWPRSRTSPTPTSSTASSPARVTFLDRLGAPFQSTFRPQEALTAQVLAGAASAVRALRPQLVIQGGDLIDNDQPNELERALAVLRGGPCRPGSGPDGYYGVQSASDTDPFYYRPDVDAPRYPGLLRRAVRPFTAAGVAARSCPVLGDHDALVAGELVPTALTRSLAVGDRALWDLPPGLTLPAGDPPTLLASPDGPPDPGVWSTTSCTGRWPARPCTVPADPRRRELGLRRGARPPALPDVRRSHASGRLDYTLDLGPRSAPDRARPRPPRRRLGRPRRRRPAGLAARQLLGAATAG